MAPNNAGALPIDEHLAAISQAVRDHSTVIVQAAPGAGKTTRVPLALLAAGPAIGSGQIVVLEPRRLAARLSAERVAEELGEAVGKQIGYQVRFDGKASAATRVLYVTEGVFMRRLLDDPYLTGVACVVIDEFHERHIHTDLALACTRKLQDGARSDLRLVVMSATLDVELLRKYLPNAKQFVVEGRTHPVALEYWPFDEGIDMEVRVVQGVRRILTDPRCRQDVLVFLTGIREILACAEALRRQLNSQEIDILPLTAELPQAEQQRVFAPSLRRKVILATNVAETSLTIPGITGVIDGGRAKIAGHAAWSGMPTLEVKRTSQAACIQRAGRAGRLSAGVAYRLFSEADYLSRPTHSSPDIERMEFADTLLSLLAWREAARESWSEVTAALPWFEPPQPSAVDAAWQLLRLLQIVDTRRGLTDFGSRVAQIPLHPRLGAVVVKGQQNNAREAGLLVACLISEGMILSGNQAAAERATSDILLQAEILCDLSRGRQLSSRALGAAINPAAVQRVRRLYDLLARRLGTGPLPEAGEISAEAIARCLMAGFPDRVARRRRILMHNQKPGARPLYNFCLGRGGILAESSVVHDAELILAIDASETLQARSKDRSVTISLASEIKVETLLEGPSELLSERLDVDWNADAQRVDVWTRLFYGQIVANETRATVREVDQSAIEDLLRQKLQEHWPKPFADEGDLRSYHQRLRHLEAAGLAEPFPRFEGDMLELLQASICEGKRSFKEIAERTLGAYLLEQLPYDAQRLLAEAVPEDIVLTNGRRLKVYYDADRQPYVEGYVQDFYGVTKTPTLLAGSLTLVLHLLGPNRRPLQVTSDLESFWRQHYPAIRSEYGRNYPRHYWPDDPRAAQPHLHKAKVPKSNSKI